MEQIWERNPALQELYFKEKEQPLIPLKISKTNEIKYIIPIVVHIMHDNGSENISDDQVKSQIEVLNEDFGKYNYGYNGDPVGVDTRIRFCLASYDENGDTTSGINRVEYSKTNSFNVDDDELTMKSLIQWDPNKYLNIWVVKKINDGTILGYSYFPSSQAGSTKDGLVIRYDFLGRKGNLNPFASGRTVTHEIGHYLNLEHPWGDFEGGDCIDDDGIDDTPKCKDPYYSIYPDCYKPYQCNFDRMIENYMDYSDDSCMNIFTAQQTIKMQNAIIQYRNELVSVENLAAAGCNSCTSCDTASYENKVHIYPNPATNNLTVYFDYKEVKTLTIKLFDRAGRVIYSDFKEKMQGGPIFIDVSKFSSGLYILRINSEQENEEYKVLIQ
ncbi:MAG: T9SS type A sorting domain-containing protein [Bacteroidia bacterium]|nr:T9SS type A sorting domain-containing protein [Bacteroidia bacterium]